MRPYEHYEKEILEIIKAKNIFTIEMIFTFYSGISRSQFYELNLNKSDTIKNALDDNKNRTKHSMLSNWYKSNNPLLQIALYKVIATEEEYHRVASTKTENKNINIDEPFDLRGTIEKFVNGRNKKAE